MVFSPGTLVAGRYVVVNVIAEGAFGTVLRVDDRESGQLRAFKVLKTSDPLQRRRLLLEGRHQGELEHENIVRVYELLELDSGPALVQELVAGPSLADLLLLRTLEPEESGRVGEGILRGLIAAHEAGLVHRDLKPANILLGGAEPAWIAKISDFGLLKDLEAAGSLTAIGVGMGSPGYMAPEQYTDAAGVDHRADLFSIGAVLFEVLVGRRAFPGGTVVEQFRAAMECAFTPPERLAPGHPPGRYAAIRSALVADPADRIGSAQALLQLWTTPETHAVIGAVASAMRGADFAQPPGTLAQIPLEVPTPALGPQSGNLPTRTNTFVGRVQDLADLAELAEGGRRLISILGAGGSGKSSLAVQYAQRSRAQYPGGAWLCDCAEARSPEALCGALARALDLRLTDGEPLAQLAEALRGRGSCLLILDNLEQMADQAAPVVEGWVQRAPELRILVTSRVPLRAAGEQLLPLEPLSCPRAYGEQWADLPSYPAVQLFVARAREVQPRFELTAANAYDVAAIVRELDGLPLAVELAAARVRMMTPRTILQRLNRRFDLLKGKRAGTADRSSTLRGAIDGSWDLLGEGERSALMHCSVFPGTFSFEAAEAVVRSDNEDDWALDQLEALVDHSLLRRVEGPEEERFELLSTIRAYASEKLGADTAGRREAVERHGRHFATSSGAARLGELDGPEGLRLMQGLLEDRDDLLVAAEAALKRGDAGIALPTVRALAALAEVHGPIAPTLALVDRARAVRTIGDHASAQLLYDRACLELAVGRPDEAAEDLERARDLADEAGDLALVADTWRKSGVACRRLRKLDPAEAALEQARALHQQLGQVAAAAIDALNLANVAFARPDLPEATRRYEEALAELRLAGNRREMGVALGNLATVRMRKGDDDGARAAFEEALPALDEAGNRRAQAVHRIVLGTIERRQGRLDEAGEHLDSALKLARHLGDRRLEGRALSARAQLARQTGRHDDARVGFVEARALHRATRNRRSEALTSGNLGETLLELGRHGEAATELQAATRLCAELELNGAQGAFLGALGEALAEGGDLGAARGAFDEGERLLGEAEEHAERGKLLARRGIYFAARGDRAAAAADLAEVERLATTTGSGRNVELGRSAERLRAVLAAREPGV